MRPTIYDGLSLIYTLSQSGFYMTNLIYTYGGFHIYTFLRVGLVYILSNGGSHTYIYIYINVETPTHLDKSKAIS